LSRTVGAAIDHFDVHRVILWVLLADFSPCCCL
jgi:hypothetical protein